MHKRWDDRIAELKEMELRLRAAEEADASCAPEVPCLPPSEITGLTAEPGDASRWEYERPAPLPRSALPPPRSRIRSRLRSLARALLRLGGWRDAADQQ